MERYNKYLVLKIADIRKYLSDEQQLKLDALNARIRVGRLNDGKQDQQYVCVAADWPMYEQVWGMIEAFVDGKPNEIEQLTAIVLELEEEKKELQALLDFDNARLDQIEDELEDVEYLGSFVEGIKVLKTQLAAEQEEWNQCSGLLDDAHRSIEMLEDQLAKAEQRVAELEAENAKLHEQVDLQVPKMAFTQLKGQLAAEQLNNKLLRKALEFLDSRIVTMDLGGVVERALSHPASTEALDKYVAEKVKEATLPVADELQKTRLQMITDFGQYQESHEQVATLTRQRDLAVEALRVAAEQIRKCDYTPARSTLLVAIKESEAMAQGEKKGV